MTEKDVLLDGVPDGDVVWMSHQDKVLTLPKGFRTIAHSDNSPHAAIKSAEEESMASSFTPRCIILRKESEY